MYNNLPEAYVHLSADEKVLTFYYDALRAERDGTTWGIEEMTSVPVSCCSETFPIWTGTEKEPNTTITTIVFDALFCDFCPTSTYRWFY